MAGSGEAAWRLPLAFRVVIIATQAIIPGIAASLFWVPWSGGGTVPQPMTWSLLAVTGAAWLVLARRAWNESVTLTADSVVIRNVFRIRRLPLAGISLVRWRHNHMLVISAEVRAAPGPAAPAGGRHRGRHAAGLAVAAAATRLGAAGYSGRRTRADEFADSIAAAAGLPPLPPRKAVMKSRQAAIALPAGLALYLIGTALKAGTNTANLIPSARSMTGDVSFLAGFMLGFPAAMVLLDRSLARLRRPGAGPAAGSPGP